MTPSPELCNEAEITTMVHAFYGEVRRDAVLGPIFNAHVDDWDHHLVKLVDFWSSVLCGTGRFSGAPMPKHAALPGLTPELFQRWLALFRETTAALPNRAMGEQAYMVAQRIARSLWYGYQLSRNRDALPRDLSPE
ncbi:MAG TPA: group III truncated hemoglobin [Burkholderiales bacterium]